ncbi:uncharacterized protein DEA37_0005677 [Paragonimus westermani]|uniref:Reverse transcriptase domain-containing protein n=1 Tax=Paragonimus westermani TaxID=34504 RepID=A0A5J4NYC8_9TREM|nr:uncharacterized protein DEA37_0005677 [Paragonimus westermani]
MERVTRVPSAIAAADAKERQFWVDRIRAVAEFHSDQAEHHPTGSASIILRRLTADREVKIREEQAGFCPGRGCVDYIFTLRQILEQRHIYRRQTIVVFLDYKGAFDSGDQSTLLEPLKRRAQIRVYGVRQGRPLSPFLFNFVMDEIMEDCLRHSQDAGVDLLPGERLTYLDYADDKVLLFDNFQLAQIAYLPDPQDKEPRLSVLSPGSTGSPLQSPCSGASVTRSQARNTKEHLDTMLEYGQGQHWVDGGQHEQPDEPSRNEIGQTDEEWQAKNPPIEGTGHARKPVRSAHDGGCCGLELRLINERARVACD